MMWGVWNRTVGKRWCFISWPQSHKMSHCSKRSDLCHLTGINSHWVQGLLLQRGVRLMVKLRIGKLINKEELELILWSRNIVQGVKTAKRTWRNFFPLCLAFTVIWEYPIFSFWKGGGGSGEREKQATAANTLLHPWRPGLYTKLYQLNQSDF